MYDLIIRNAVVAGPDGVTRDSDLAVSGHRIARIGASISAAARESIDAAGHLLLPGVIDPQVHFRDPGAPHKEDIASGSRAAVSGGVTSFLEMPNTAPPVVDQAGLDDKLRRAADGSVANYGFFIGATPDNLDEINRAQPACGIKIFMGSSTGELLVSQRRDLERIFANGDRLIAVHAEDEQRIRSRIAELLPPNHDGDPSIHSTIRDAECAARATTLALELSERYERRLHILHLSTAEEVEILRRNKPPWVSAEAIPNHLLLNVDDYAQLGSLVQMNPPVRSVSDNEALWRGLHDGVIDIIATDHAPHTREEKRAPYPSSPSGMPGVETSLPLMLTEMDQGRCSLAQILRWMCEGPARLYRIPDKGRLEEGYDADLTVVDVTTHRPVENQRLFTRVGWSPFAGRSLTGWPLYTVVGGQIAFERGRIRASARGRALTFAA